MLWDVLQGCEQFLLQIAHPHSYQPILLFLTIGIGNTTSLINEHRFYG